MPLALASGWLRDGADELSRAAREARRLGFSQVFASVPPRDARRAKDAMRPLDVTLAGIASDAVDDPNALRAAVDRAADTAVTLARPLVVVDVGGATAAGARSVEAAVEAWARAVHDAIGAWSGLAIAVRPAGEPSGLFGFRETEWLLDDLAGKPAGLWLDPARATRRHG